MAQTDFFGPVINALVARQRIIESKQQEEARKKQLEQADKRIDLLEKESERRFKQQEDLAKARKLTQGVMLQGLASELHKEMVGSIMAPAQKQIPGAGQIQQQPLLENILQQRGLASSLPQQDIVVRGQENAPVNLEIPDPETGQPQLRVPIGSTSELLRERGANEVARRQEEQRQLQILGQTESLKARAKAGAELPAKLLLERAKNENAIALETDRQKNREALERLKGSFRIAAAKHGSANQTAFDIPGLANYALDVGVGAQKLTGSVKEKAAVTTLLKQNNWEKPPDDLLETVDTLGQFPLILGQMDSLIEKTSKPGIFGVRADQLGRQAHQFVTGSNEIINQAETINVNASQLLRLMHDRGAFSNKDIERGQTLLFNPDIAPKDNIRRRELLGAMAEIGINNKLRGLSDDQKRAIFERYDIPYRVLTQEQIKNRYKEIDNFIGGAKEAEATPSDNTSDNAWNHPKYGQLNVGEERNIVVNGKPIKAKVAKKSDGSFGWVEVK